jgi:hypothetical protein
MQIDWDAIRKLAEKLHHLVLITQHYFAAARAEAECEELGSRRRLDSRVVSQLDEPLFLPSILVRCRCCQL